MSIRRPIVRHFGFTIALSAGLYVPNCIPTEFGDHHAARVEAYLPTPFVDEDARFLDPEQSLGPPDGRTVALGAGSYVILRFFREVADGPGDDLLLYEIGPDDAEARVAVSVDSDLWYEFPDKVVGQVTSLDLKKAEMPSIFFVRIRGVDMAGHEPGYDLDAVEALH
ncbi:MAG: hypothetical protein KTR25_12040 [Myxococcales bacterium]|nr:hypothetical protein [Myxococcales bacterium]